MHYYEILPLQKTSAKEQTFTYSYSEEIAIRSLVKINLRNKNLRGIVIKKVPKPPYKTKEITELIYQKPILSDWQLELAKRISNYYLATIGEAVNNFVSFKVAKRKLRINNQELQKIKPEAPPKLTTQQKEIIEKIEKQPAASKSLIFGVTGSGKTEIYLQLAQKALESEGQTVILVPEISLTPQTYERVIKRLPQKAAIWHSQLSPIEKFYTWEKVKNKEINVILGARSALFLPFSDLRYIIIDEEHESSYKQDKAPRYEAARVAEWLTELTGAKLVLGTATPKIETFYKVQKGEYNLYSLNKRIVQKDMPPVYVIDMRDEFRKKNFSIFSEKLQNAIKETIKNKKQVLLFVNRRGASTFTICRDCGYVEKCPRCEIPLVYHLNEKEHTLRCHYCNYQKNVPSKCPDCKSYAIKHFGLGTQRAELEAKKLFPEAKIKRLDSDTAHKKDSIKNIFENYREGKFDILIGTQMITKGWDLPNINLIGVISADTNLNIPDYKSAEKTFGLLTQVAGRTGRGTKQGRVIIQTYNPDNYAIKYAQKHDFESFYQEEIKNRKKYFYPPFSRIIKLLYRSKKEEEALQKANTMYQKLVKILPRDFEIKEPTHSFIYKKMGYFNWQIIVKAPLNSNIFEINKKIAAALEPNWIADVDPDNLL